MLSPFLFLSSLLFLSGTVLTAWETPLFSTNTTVVQVGRPFTARCTLVNYQATSDSYYVRFWRNNFLLNGYFICEYYISAGTLKLIVNSHQFTDIDITPLWYNDTAYEIQIVPKTLDVYSYQCDNPGPFSAIVYMTVVASLPTATFTVNVSKAQVGVPFTASCALSHFTPSTLIDSSYLVSFHSKRDGLLSTFKVENGQSEVQIKKHANLTVHPGERSTFPTFDLQITEKGDQGFAEYWCTLNNGSTYESNHWTDGPVVKFSTVKLNATDRYGACYIDNFNTSGAEYSVKFITSSGANSAETLLATFYIKPNRILEFDTEDVSGWTRITKGEKVAYPNFRVTVSGTNPLTGTWWCAVGVGAEGSVAYREYKSNRVGLP